MNKLQVLAAQFAAGEMDKYEFYEATMGFGIHAIHLATGIDHDVIRDRRRYLRQLRAIAIEERN